ncbi:RNase A-like domain-containing protein [Candidatus Fokinia crypta]|uniref:Bacterial CdiA-CT RNAse A domain-containing protein n=1 Tax=Candidatus Fokinia crypta TaxID=1920990 RepID=A0ABZ0UR20_9RICK|nr:RNase A-like domain-containing protein [Candidatus Fokinia cryptica]WPX98149.1 hypothetical protein Fokcrypt_00688 [Candidatus Fokinia cryptica]
MKKLMYALLTLIVFITNVGLAEERKEVAVCEEKLVKYTIKFDIIENDNVFFSHTYSEHIGKSDVWLKSKMYYRNMNFASTYFNKEIANDTIRKALRDNKGKICMWLDSLNKMSKSDNRRKKALLLVTTDVNKEIGFGIQNDGKKINLKRANIVLKATSHEDVGIGLYVFTSYPAKSRKYEKKQR